MVEEVGEGADGLEPGDWVRATLPFGSYAEEFAVAATILLISDGIDYVRAAAFPLACSAEHLALVHRASLRTDEGLLVHGAAVNVGRAAVEVSKQLRAIIATDGSEERLSITTSEYGVAQPRGSNIRERTRKLIGIAYPRFRNELQHQGWLTALHHDLLDVC